jgi:hypothetical protein
MDIQIEPCDKAEMFSDTMITMILFNATMTAATQIKDKGYKQRAKEWMQHWFNSGIRLWKEISRTTKEVPMAIDSYEELSGYVYEVVKIALEQPDYNEFLKNISSLK